MKRVIYLVVAALRTMVVIVPPAAAQGENVQQALQQAQENLQQAAQELQQLREGAQEEMQERTMVIEKMPKSGGVTVGSVFLPAAALLLGSGVLAYAILRRRR